MSSFVKNMVSRIEKRAEPEVHQRPTVAALMQPSVVEYPCNITPSHAAFEGPVVVEAAANGNELLLSVQAPQLTTSAPVNICFVLDVSGSMSLDVEHKGGEGPTLRRIDIAKHSIKAVISSLTARDVVSLVLYSDNARIEIRQVNMTEEAKAEASQKIDMIEPHGGTNMWVGMLMAYEILQESAGTFANQHMLVLTDGANPDIPRLGFVGEMRQFKEQHHEKYPCLVHTFGFAYDLDSKLLVNIANEGQGMYAFIPDGSMVGTVFINAFANAAITVGHRVSLSVEMTGTAKITKVEGIPADKYHSQTWGGVVTLPCIQESRKWDLVFTTDLPLANLSEDVVIRLTYNNSAGEPISVSEFASVDFSSEAVAVIRAREALIALIKPDLLNTYETTLPLTIETLNALKAATTTAAARAAIEGFLEDVTGQVTEAVTVPMYYGKWGRHYLPSLKRGHELQQCNNFKDPGLQVYASPLFETIRTAAEDVFMRLPPPNRNARFGYGSTYGQSRVDLSQYMDRYGGCIYGQCDVAMANGKSVKVAQLKKGDKLDSGRVVRCVVKTPYCSKTTEFFELDELKITAWHPVYVAAASESSWQFPCEASGAKKWTPASEQGFLFSFVLEEKATETSEAAAEAGVLVNGYYCAALGHGVTNDKTLAHSFLGTSRVVQALSTCRGFEEGLVTVMFTRSDTRGPLDGLIDMQQ